MAIVAPSVLAFGSAQGDGATNTISVTLSGTTQVGGHMIIWLQSSGSDPTPTDTETNTFVHPSPNFGAIGAIGNIFVWVCDSLIGGTTNDIVTFDFGSPVPTTNSMEVVTVGNTSGRGPGFGTLFVNSASNPAIVYPPGPIPIPNSGGVPTKAISTVSPSLILGFICQDFSSPTITAPGSPWVDLDPQPGMFSDLVSLTQTAANVPGGNPVWQVSTRRAVFSIASYLPLIQFTDSMNGDNW